MADDRVLRLEGVHNFRDFGGYPVSGGGRLRRGLLWRSGQHHGATDADLARIAALKLAGVFDLRSGRERDVHPCRRPERFAARVRHAQDPREHAAPHVAAAARVARQRTPESTREQLIASYSGIAFRPGLQAITADLIASAAAGEGAALVNCMAGKDRTGFAVAMVHLAAGVHRDDVMEDYLLTNTAGDVEARIASGAETLRAITGQVDDACVRVLMAVEPVYLDTALATIEAEYGSTDRYLAQALGADESRRGALRAHLVE